LDPIHRLVSVAHINGKVDAAKRLFDEAGLDFYDWHAYDDDDDKFLNLVEAFGPDKPLTLTEWGWEVSSPEAVYYENHFDDVLDLVADGKISGHMFWSWNDVPQYTRKDWATYNGILRSGGRYRKPRIARACLFPAGGVVCRKKEVATAPQPRPITLPLKSVPFSSSSTFQSVDLQVLVGFC
jgi:hypothetical protein